LSSGLYCRVKWYITQKTTLNIILAAVRTWNLAKILLPLPGIEPRSSGRPVCSQAEYWLSHPLLIAWLMSIQTTDCEINMLHFQHQQWWTMDCLHVTDITRMQPKHYKYVAFF
jgi:hypothetical protein